MSRQSGILAVNRFEFLRLAARAGVRACRKPAVEILAEEVRQRYRGFDGLARVVFGAHPELRLFARRLNEHLLLSRLEDALEMIPEAAGNDRERDIGIGTIAVLLHDAL